MQEGENLNEHINVFSRMVLDLAHIEVQVDDEVKLFS
jgi:hypothetical protein